MGMAISSFDFAILSGAGAGSKWVNSLRQVFLSTSKSGNIAAAGIDSSRETI
jgi:hypothetical protein